VPPARGILKTAFSLRYQDIKVGTGADAEPGKLYKVQYTGWLAADGHKFDSSYDHPRAPVLDKDGKPVLDADGKPKQGDPQPLSFPQGFGRLIPGWDQGFYGMKVGGKRRLFIPWQLAYGARGRPGPDAAHPGIPPKADLIFDVELVDISDFQMPQRPGMMPPGRPMPPGAARPGMPPAPGTPPAPGSTPAPAAPGATPAPGQPAAPAAPAAPPQTSTPPKPATTGQPAAPATPPQPQTN
jgi:peptidylprolyl isomerase